MKKIINNVKKNKFVYLICFVVLGALIFTHFNTFLANDDLPYSFFYRGENRITSLGQVLANQLADYKYLNGRFMVHCVLQIVLMFGKNIWSIINPIMIITSIVMLCKLAKLKTSKLNFSLALMIGFILYLLLIDYKQIIYWVAGSVNYVWVFTLLIIFVYLFYRYGFSRIKIINTLGIALFCALHECTMVFTIIFILGNMIYEWIKNKKFNYNYIWYVIGFVGSLVLLLSPANNLRLVSDEFWNSMSFIEKLLTSIPVVSKNLFNLSNFNNILPYFFIAVVCFDLVKVKDKCSVSIICAILLNVIMIAIIQNEWLYFVLTLILVLGEHYSNVKNGREKLCILSLAFYAVVFSNIITPLYAVGRPNYYFYMYMIFYIVLIMNELISNVKVNKKFVYGFVILLFGFMIGREVYIYKLIGGYHQDRLDAIKEYKDNGSEGTLYLKEIPEELDLYHIDVNLPTKDWFTYRYYLNYYGLPQDINIVYR